MDHLKLSTGLGYRNVLCAIIYVTDALDDHVQKKNIISDVDTMYLMDLVELMTGIMVLTRSCLISYRTMISGVLILSGSCGVNTWDNEYGYVEQTIGL